MMMTVQQWNILADYIKVVSRLHLKIKVIFPTVEPQKALMHWALWAKGELTFFSVTQVCSSAHCVESQWGTILCLWR